MDSPYRERKGFSFPLFSYLLSVSFYFVYYSFPLLPLTKAPPLLLSLPFNHGDHAPLCRLFFNNCLFLLHLSACLSFFFSFSLFIISLFKSFLVIQFLFRYFLLARTHSLSLSLSLKCSVLIHSSQLIPIFLNFFPSTSSVLFLPPLNKITSPRSLFSFLSLFPLCSQVLEQFNHIV